MREESETSITSPWWIPDWAPADCELRDIWCFSPCDYWWIALTTISLAAQFGRWSGISFSRHIFWGWTGKLTHHGGWLVLQWLNISFYFWSDNLYKQWIAEEYNHD